jgi:hypothetical protein
MSVPSEYEPKVPGPTEVSAAMLDGLRRRVDPVVAQSGSHGTSLGMVSIVTAASTPFSMKPQRSISGRSIPKAISKQSYDAWPPRRVGLWMKFDRDENPIGMSCSHPRTPEPDGYRHRRNDEGDRSLPVLREEGEPGNHTVKRVIRGRGCQIADEALLVVLAGTHRGRPTSPTLTPAPWPRCLRLRVQFADQVCG